jgi:hypothetical protein
MAISADHLGGWHSTQIERLGNFIFNTWVDIAVGANRARQLADRNRVSRSLHASAITVDLQCPQSNLGAERRWLGMNAVGASDHHCRTMGSCFANEHIQQRAEGRVDQLGGITQHRTPRRVNDIATRQSVVQPGSFWSTDAILGDVDERRNVVIRHYFAFCYRTHEALVNLWRTRATRGGSGLGYGSIFGLRVEGVQFDFEISRKAGSVAEERRHLWS